MQHKNVLETIMKPIPKKRLRAISLNQEDVLGLLTIKKEHSLPVNESELNGFEIVMDENKKPQLGYINGVFGIFTRREIHPNSGKYERGIIVSPFGAPNDELWVQETWRIGAWREDGQKLAIDYKITPEFAKTPWVYPPNQETFDRYHARILAELTKKGITPDADGHYRWEAGNAPLSWRSSTSMPHWASRLTLNIHDVYIEPIVGSMPIQWQFTARFDVKDWIISQETSEPATIDCQESPF